jgi:hypothetical protein
MLAVSALLSTVPTGQAAATNPAPDFQEVYGLIRAHVTGATDAELNAAALQGLLSAFKSKVALVEANDVTNLAPEGPLIAQARLFDGRIAYLRIVQVGEGLDREVAAAYRRLASTNTLQGIVLDLRYADGSDYPAAVAVADLFDAKTQPLIDWGSGMVSSRQTTNAIRLPVAVLVNAATSRAAEVLAALVRETGAGLILGGRTAGQAFVDEIFPLKDGAKLRIACAPIHLGDGTTLDSGGITPDIAVTVSPQDERMYYADAFAVVGGAGSAGRKAGATNRVETASSASPRGYMNEAELVREHQQGLDADQEGDLNAPPPRRTEPAPPVVTDKTLARALDLLKGLAVVRQDRF